VITAFQTDTHTDRKKKTESHAVPPLKKYNNLAKRVFYVSTHFVFSVFIDF
jgi:hypothetical protein